MSTPSPSTDFHYFATKPMSVGHGDAVIDLIPGDIVPREVAEMWGRAPDLLIRAGKMAVTNLWHEPELEAARKRFAQALEEGVDSAIERVSGGAAEPASAADDGDESRKALADAAVALGQAAAQITERDDTIAALTARVAELEAKAAEPDADAADGGESTESGQETPGPVVTDTFPKHTGGGFYQLSNGERMRGKGAALAAEAGLAAPQPPAES